MKEQLFKEKLNHYWKKYSSKELDRIITVHGEYEYEKNSRRNEFMDDLSKDFVKTILEDI